MHPEIVVILQPMKLDILVFAAHPDDAELGCGGLILKSIAQGKKVGLVDFTQGELGTRGTAETRKQEAADAAEILGLHHRENLGFRDGFFKNDEAHQLALIQKIRQFKPEIVITNALDDRHPDHKKGGDVANDALFLSGLPKIKTEWNGVPQEAHRPRLVLQYIQDRYIQPDIVLDISDFMSKKLEAIRAFKTQFFDPNAAEAPNTYISNPAFLESVIGRAREFGKNIGANFGEGFTCRKLLGVDDIFQLK